MSDLIERLRDPRYCGQEGLRAEAADEITALRERVAALEGAARSVCDGQATPALINNLRAILAKQETSHEG